MSRSFLESTFLTACPTFEATWASHRGALPPTAEPRAEDFFALLRQHMLGLIAAGRVAEFTRVLHTVERLFVEGDPILEDLLAETLARPLAAELQRTGALWAQAEPYFGPRTRRAVAAAAREGGGDADAG